MDWTKVEANPFSGALSVISVSAPESRMLTTGIIKVEWA